MAYLSIIIPVYNAEKYLRKCVDSILSQSFEDYELILVDDGSTDKSGEICDEYAVKDKRVKTLHVGNGGPSKARNYALNLANGEYVEFIDSDDCLIENSLQEMYEISKEQKESVIIANSVVVDENNKVLQPLYLKNNGTKNVSGLLSSITPLNKAILLHYLWNKWYRRQIIEDNNIRFDEKLRLGEDFIFNCKVFGEINTIAINKNNLYYYYKRNNESLSSKFNFDELNRRRVMDTAFINLFKEKEIFDINQDHIEEMIGAIALSSIRAVESKNSPRRRQQLQYVKGFLNSEYHSYLLCHLYSKNKKSIADDLELKLLKHKWISLFIVLEKIRKRKCR